MAKPKKQGREERLRKKRLAEKKRYERIKANEDLWKEKQEKNRQSYLRRKEEKKVLSINEMNPRDQRRQRKKWRKNFKSYYLRKKQEQRTIALLNENTPPSSPINIPHEDVSAPDPQEQDPLLVSSPSPLISQHVPPSAPSPTPGPSTRGKIRNFAEQNSVNSTLTEIPASQPSSSQKVRQMRYKKDKEIKHLQEVIMMQRKKNECLRKQIGRLQNQKINTPTSSLNSGSTTVTKKLKTVRKRKNRKVKKTLSRLPEEVKKSIEMYYENDENSRMCSGKKEFIVRNKIRKQKRYLNDSLLNLHRNFLQKSSFVISYSAFCKMRPFWVLEPNAKTRDTCLCSLHTNMDLLVDSMHRRKIIPAHNGKALLALLCCDTFDVNCLQRKCLICKDRVIPYQEFDNSEDVVYSQWVTKSDDTKSTQKKIRITEKVKIKEEPLKCIEKLESTLNKEYFNHCGNIVAQQKAFRTLKNNLKQDECIIHMDFSENYSVKCNQEVQSYHFGGSRKQITLHTSVLYFMDEDENQQVQSFCTLSDCPRHDVAAVWAHIVPILTYLSEKNANMQTVHFISDSPSSQYRNKKIFHLISSLQIYLSAVKTVTWNYSEAGHGKGAPDGVGAALKSAADRAVSRGQDIKDLDDFIRVVSCVVTNVILRTVSEYDVSEKEFLIPQTVKPFVGSMKMHQIVWSFDLNVMAVRTLSCTEKECLYKAILCTHDKHLGFYSLINNVAYNTPLRNMESSPETERADIVEDNNYVTPLSESRNIHVGSSFWRGCTETTHDVDQQTKENRNKKLQQKINTKSQSMNLLNQQRKEKNNTKLDHQRKNTKKPTFDQQPKEKKTTKQTKENNNTKLGQQLKEKGIIKLNKQTMKKNNSNQLNQEKRDTELLRNTEKLQTSQKERPTYTKEPQKIAIRKAPRSALASIRIKSFREKFISKERENREEAVARGVDNQIDNMHNHEQGDLENLSFSNDFNVDLENIHAYTMSDDDDDLDYNIFYLHPYSKSSFMCSKSVGKDQLYNIAPARGGDGH